VGLAANAIILPITGWLIAHLGRRNYILLSIAVGQLIRVIQGLAGGGLQPSSQGFLLDAIPPERQGMAMTLFGLAALIAPVVGPTLGGWITDDYSWRRVFWINVPVGLLALGACAITFRDPDYPQRSAWSFGGDRSALTALACRCWSLSWSVGR
jgi:DHA2 family multidrug resistance protein